METSADLPSWTESLDSIRRVAELSEGLALVLAVGPSTHAREGLERIEEAARSGRETVWHRLDEQGVDLVESLVAAEAPRALLLVHGLERLVAAERQEVEVRLNLLRDALARFRAFIVLWVPAGELEAFRRRCPDLFHWRSLLVRLTEEDLPLDPVLVTRRRYLQRLYTELGELPLPLDSGKTLPDVYVDPEVRVRDKANPMPFGRWVTSVQYGLLEGQVGSGKTAALEMRAFSLAKRALDDDQAPVPLRIVLRAQGATAELSMLDRLASASSLETELLRLWIRQGNLELLVDGFDEIALEQRVVWIEGLNELRSHYPNLRILVSGRPGVFVSDGWSRAELVPWSGHRIDEYLRRRWGDSDRDVDLDLLFDRTKHHEVASSPLMLEIITSLSNASQRIPTERSALLGVYVDFLLNRWDAARQLQALRPVASPRNLRRRLSALALRSLQQGSDSFRLEDLADWDYAEDSIHYLETRANLVRPVSSGAYEFSHRTFLEHFAAEELVDLGPTAARRLVYPHLDDPSWREVIVMAVARLVRQTGLEEWIWDDLWPRDGDSLGQEQSLGRKALALDCAVEAGLTEIAMERGHLAWIELVNLQGTGLRASRVLSGALQRLGRRWWAHCPDHFRDQLAEFLTAQLEQPVLKSVSEDVLVDLRVVPQDEWDASDSEEEDNFAVQLFKNRWDALLSLPGRRTFLVGVPGAGKTVSLAQLAIHLSCRAIESDVEDSVLPIWLEAPELPEGPATAWEILEAVLTGRGLRGLPPLGPLVEAGKAVLLIDRMQEAPRERRLVDLLNLRGLIKVVTARPELDLSEFTGAQEMLRILGLRASDRQRLAEQLALDPDTRSRAVILAWRAQLEEWIEIPQFWRIVIEVSMYENVDLSTIHSPTTLLEAFLRQHIRKSLEEPCHQGFSALTEEDIWKLLELLGAAVVFNRIPWSAFSEAVTLQDWNLDTSRLLAHCLALVFQPAGSEREGCYLTQPILANFLTARLLWRTYSAKPPKIFQKEASFETVQEFILDLRDEARSRRSAHQIDSKVERLIQSLDPELQNRGERRGSAATTLGHIGDPRAVESLIRSLDPNFEGDGVTRGSAATALGRIGDPRAVEGLIRSLDPNFETRGETRGSAATALGRIGDPRAVEGLIRSLDPNFEGDGVTRGSAATALGRIGDPRAVEGLIRSLDPQFEARGDARGSAATALGCIGDPRAMEELTRCRARETDSDVRRSLGASIRLLKPAPQKPRDSPRGLQAAWQRLLVDLGYA